MVLLKELMKTRIINNMVREVQPKAKWKVLVVDAATLKILSAVCKMYDILEENVTLVESIEKKRQPYPNLEAIYFLSPTSKSVELFIDDFTGGASKNPNKYLAAHLYFVSGLPEDIFQRLTQSHASKFVLSLKETFIDFLAFESQVFTFDRRESFLRIYSPKSPSPMSEFDEIASKLVSVCAVLGENPAIRYYCPNEAENVKSYSRQLAKVVQKKLDDYAKDNEGFPSTKNMGTLIIVERTYDQMAPLLHEFTYQAMANDVLKIENGVKYVPGSSGMSSDGGESKGKEVILDEADSLWVELRHVHIADCITKVIGSFNSFLTQNKAATKMAQSKGGVSSLKELKETLTAVPQFQELKAKFAVHISIAQDCMSLFEKQKLSQVGDVEQCIATGETSKGEIPKNIVADMVPLLDDPSITETDKVRLLMLYVIHKEGVTDEDRRKLLDHARLNSNLRTAITNLALLGIKLTNTPGTKSKAKHSKNKNKNEDDGYELSRYIGNVKTMIENHLNNKLDSKIFPYLREPPPTAVLDQEVKTRTISSLRSTKPSWQKKGAEKEKHDSAESLNGPRTIIFMIGGLTYSESRAAYELTQTFKKEVIIGSSHMITPREFVDDLSRINSFTFGSSADLSATKTASKGSSSSLTKPLRKKTSSLGFDFGSKSKEVTANRRSSSEKIPTSEKESGSSTTTGSVRGGWFKKKK